MIERERWPVPHGTGGGVGHTRVVNRVVLAVVHSVAGGQRLFDVLAAAEKVSDVQVVFTRPPGPKDNGVGDLLKAQGALETPWDQAVHEQFDLVVSISGTAIDSLGAPALLLPALGDQGQPVDHHGRPGVAAIRRVRKRRGAAGHPIPLAVGLPQRRDVALLRSTFPDIGQHAEVVGDPSFDRLLRTIGLRTAIRRKLGVKAGERVGLVLSSRGPESLFGRSPGILAAIGRANRHRNDRVFCQLHPAVWIGHGSRQVMAWCEEASQEGVAFVQPGQDWCPLLVASDYVIGDHGIVTSYAAAIGKPVFLAHPLERAAARSALVGLPVLDPSHALHGQLDLTATANTPHQRITSAPRRSADLLQSLFLRLLKLPARPKEGRAG
ncbi:hypothetical protein [Amycolatopsis anabasis]|uniref:hypothetical protein n=1 Tax=Amycolatopsis anabasis TaxID=1840409 RepID=UPI00131DBED2|nr:hypothetical protein [Amycolatopsis anabasis]